MPKNKEQKKDELFIVGIGSSAGGLEALSLLLNSLSKPLHNVALIICQHMSPDFKSRLAEILQNSTLWNVLEISDMDTVKGGVIYVTPPNNHLEIEKGLLRLSKYQNEKPVPSINRFFKSLAKEIGSKAIGIILSGTGSDGAEGMKEITENGGYALVQDPGDAKHKDMPQSVINEQIYDKILLAQEIPNEINQFINNFSIVRNSDLENNTTEKEVNQQIFQLLESRTGTNFAKYKPSTILRRINKRLEFLNIISREEYLEYIKKSPKELDKLFETVLIGVTEFFRDTLAFQSLEKYLKKLIAEKKEDRNLRVWSVGTSTGEEAYTIAIMLSEILGERIKDYEIQIFATDIDEKALAIARKGHYSYSSVEKMPENIINKYFKQESSYYEIKKSLRQLILFSKHDISSDPPFLKLDFLICRNVLIYFNNELQKEVMHLFHHALLQEGLLFLGKSESSAPGEEFFDQIDKKQKLYKKVTGNDAPYYRIGRFSTKIRNAEKPKREEKNSQHTTIIDQAKDAILNFMPHPYVIINTKKDILEVKGSIRLYVELKEGAGNLNINKLINPELNLELRALLSKCESKLEYQSSYVIKFELFGHYHYVKLHIYPIPNQEPRKVCYMVVFEEIDPNQIISNKTKEKSGNSEDYLLALEHELATTKEHLQLFTEELETSNEELQSLNEELQSTNEELKSSNEELETSNEELQSTNEELETANQELRTTNEELIQKEEELNKSKIDLSTSLNLYTSLAENFPNGTINIVDKNYTLRFIAGQQLEKLMVKKNDLLGINVLHHHQKEQADVLEELLKKAFQGRFAQGVIHNNEIYYNVNAVPLRNIEDDEVEEVLFTTQDITDIKELEEELRKINKEKERVIESEENAIKELKIQKDLLNQLFENAPAQICIFKGREFVYEMINPQAYSYQLNERVIGKSMYKLFPEIKGSKTDQAMVRAFETGKTQTEPEIKIELIRPDTGEQISGYFTCVYIPVFNTEQEVEGVIFYGKDITKEVKARKKIKKSAFRLKNIINCLPLMAWTEDKYSNVNFFNKLWYDFTNQNPNSATQEHWTSFVYPADLGDYLRKRNNALKNGNEYEHELRLRDERDRTYLWHLIKVVPVKENERIKYWIGTAVNINDQKELELKKDEFLNIASHELKTPLTSIQGYNQLLQESYLTDVEGSKKIIDRTDRSIKRINKLINELLSVTRIESGNFKLHKTSTDLNKLVKEVISNFLDEKFRIKMSGKIDLPVEVDSERIIQVIENLISNALKFSPKDSVIHIKLLSTEKYAKIEVIDKGIGVEKEDQVKLFNRYFKVQSLNNVQGLGLGLFISNQIIISHGGEITVYSEKENGSTFTVLIPITSKE